MAKEAECSSVSPQRRTTELSRIEPIRALIVDDHPFVVDGLASLLGAQPDFQVAGACGSVTEAAALIEKLRPSLVLVDLRLPDGDGIAVLKTVHEFRWETYAVVLSAFCSEDDLVASARAGARAFLMKTDRGEAVLATLRRVVAGENVLLASLPEHIRERLAQKDLTPKELEALRMIGRGMTNRQIVLRTGLTENTIKVHLRNLFRKLGVTNRAEAAAIAVRRGLISALGIWAGLFAG